MDYMFNISIQWLIVAGINIFLLLTLFFLNVLNSIKIKRLKEKYNLLMNGSNDISLEELIEDCIQRCNKVTNKNREIENQINKLERELFNCTQKVGVVRYNAFENVGSDLSFSIVLLDKNDSGVVLSGIYSRENSVTYAKPIENGKSRYPLSAEELKALDMAQKKAYQI